MPISWESRLTDGIVNRAFREPGGELAWKAEDALAVLDELESLRLPVLGVDVWTVDGNSPTLPAGVYDLDISLNRQSVNIEDFAAFSINKAREFIETFRWAADEPISGRAPYFNFTVDD